ncbi:hypothetical protein DRN63_01315 [Nanoarchaeota archaeon]|nr:MAG: hypothetical protein DRN63_01315 [Nanoarchaeota archaeon]
MKVYIAAPFERKGEVKDLIEELKKIGFEISHDWTSHESIDPTKQKELARKYSIEDIEGVRNSDVFILLAEDRVSSGASVELGAAILSNLEFGKPIIYVVSKTRDLMFYFHPSVKLVENVTEVLEDLKNRFK